MAAVVAYIATFLEGLGVNTVVAELIAEVFVYIAATELINAVADSNSQAGSNAGEGGNLTANYTSTDASIRIVFGTIRCGGMETIPAATMGANGEFLHKVITIAGHAIDSYGSPTIGEAYLDDVNIQAGGINSITGASGDGLVNTGKYVNNVWIRRYTGASSDTTDFIFQAAFSMPSFLGKGMAKAYLTYKWDPNVFRSVPAPTFMTNGARVYDPRLDSTNGGSGSHRYATPSTWEFVHGAETYNFQSIGSNPALTLAWYLMHITGGEVDPSEIDWSTVITAANVCDAAVAIPDGLGGSITQDRYTCNGVIAASVSDWTENIKPLTDAMLGTVIFANGVWRMYAGGWQSPTKAITKGDWISGCQYTFDGGRDSRFNRSHCFFIDSLQNWSRQECYVRTNSTYKTADGGEDIDLVTQQLLCTSEFEAQRKAEFLLRQSRNQVMVSGKLPPRFQDVLLYDTVTVDDEVLGWVSKTFRVVSCKINADGTVDVGLREEQSTDWTDLLYTEYGQPSTVALPTINPTTPSAPTALTITQQVNGTLKFDIGAPAIRPVDTRFRIISSTTSYNAAVGSIVYDGADLNVDLFVPNSEHWYYAQSYVNTYASPYYPNTFGTLAFPGLVTWQTFVNTLTASNIS